MAEDETAVPEPEPPPAKTVAFETSPNITLLIQAMVKVQQQVKAAVKDSKNPHLKSYYADLASVWDACRVPLTDNGFAVVQSPERGDKDVSVRTLLLHTSGQFIMNILSAVPPKMDPQGVGSTITYLRRYSLQALVGVAPEDDDAEGAMDRTKITEEQAIALNAAILAAGKSIEKMCDFFGVTSLADLTVTDHERALKLIPKKAA